MRFQTASVTASGRVQYEPGEGELRIISKVDLEFADETGEARKLQRLCSGLLADLDLSWARRWRSSPGWDQGGTLHCTTQRVVWVGGDARGGSVRAEAVPVGSVAEVVPFKWNLFVSKTPRVRLNLRLDATGMPDAQLAPASAARSEQLCLVFRGTSQSATVFTEVLQSVVERAQSGGQLSVQRPAHAGDAHPMAMDSQAGGLTLASSPSQPLATALPDLSPRDWPCGRCTLVNASDAQECLACGAARPGAAAAPPPATPMDTTPAPAFRPLDARAPVTTPGPEWHCAACTLINLPRAQTCDACGAPAPARSTPPAGPVGGGGYPPPLPAHAPPPPGYPAYPTYAAPQPPLYPLPPAPPPPHPAYPTQGAYPGLTQPQPAGRVAYPVVASSVGEPLAVSAELPPRTTSAPTLAPPEPAARASLSASSAGIAGLLRREEEKEQARGRGMEAAFTDLSALMTQARAMVEMAELLRERVRRDRESGGGDPEAGLGQDMDDLLLDVGIANPVTKDTAGSQYHKQLSRQLADFLVEVLARRGGVMALPDVYCLFNRARGTELVSPEDLEKACRLWAKLGLPLQLDTFASGVKVVRSPEFSDDKICSKIQAITQPPALDELGPGISVGEVANALEVPLTLAKEYLLMVERRGALCRDDGPDGLRFFHNFFVHTQPESVVLAAEPMRN